MNKTKVISRDSLNRIIPALILLSIWIFSGVFQYVWLRTDCRPPVGDGIPYVLQGMRLFYGFEGNDLWTWIRSIFCFSTHIPYPPLGQVVYFLYYKCFGVTSEMEMMVNSFFLGIGLLGIYGTTSFLFNKKTGLFAAFLFTTMPGILFYSKMGMREFPLMCLFAPTLYCLVRSKYFTHAFYSLAYGICVGILFWIKAEIIFYLIPLTIAAVVGFFTQGSSGKQNVIRFMINVFLAGSCAILVACPWYLINEPHIMLSLKLRFIPARTFPVFFSTAGFGYYFVGLFKQLLTLPQGLALGILTVYFLIRRLFSAKMRLSLTVLLLVCGFVIVPLSIFEFINPKDVGHALPALVLIAIAFSALCFEVRPVALRIIIILFLIVHGGNTAIMQFLLEQGRRIEAPFTFKINPVDGYLYKDIKSTYLNQFGKLLYVAKIPWDDILKEMVMIMVTESSRVSDPQEIDSRPKVLLLANNDPLKFHQLEYYNLKAGNKLFLISPCFSDEFDKLNFRKHFFEEKYDYIITTEPTEFRYGEEDAMFELVLEFLKKEQEQFDSHYTLIKAVTLPRPYPIKALTYKRIS
jgi:hypothetical protein